MPEAKYFLITIYDNDFWKDLILLGKMLDAMKKVKGDGWHKVVDVQTLKKISIEIMNANVGFTNFKSYPRLNDYFNQHIEVTAISDDKLPYDNESEFLVVPFDVNLESFLI